MLGPLSRTRQESLLPQMAGKLPLTGVLRGFPVPSWRLRFSQGNGATLAGPGLVPIPRYVPGVVSSGAAAGST